MARTAARAAEVRVKADPSQHRVRADKPVQVAAVRVALVAHPHMRNLQRLHCTVPVDAAVNEHGRKRRRYR